MIKTIGLILLILLYVGAGINHFVHPQGYLSIIPPYLPRPDLINIVSGILEIAFGLLLIFPATRKAGATGIVILLVFFIPAHIYMIQKGGCMGKEICIPLWGAWLRLIPLQFILIAWAWYYRKANSSTKVES